MQKKYALLICLQLICATQALAADINITEVTDQDSVEFPLGKATRPNLVIRSQDNPDMSVNLGIRYQGTAQLTDPAGAGASTADIFSRRVRFEITTQFSKDVSFGMDLRNDNANRADSGERNFNVGDAQLIVKKLNGTSLLNLKAFRAKVDVSRSETAKSSWLVYYDRPTIADEAAQYVNHNRRATNFQLFGNLEHKIAYSVAVGDGVHSSTFIDASGDAANSVTSQNPMFGAKLVLSPFQGWEENERTETYFGQGQHFSLGLGAFHTGNIRFRPSATAGQASTNRTLVNAEASFHYKGFFVQSEYFHFAGAIKDFAAANLERGSSDGWYVTSEYALPQLAFIAPFVRFERWDRYGNDKAFLFLSRVAGLNWYLRGNTARVGLAAQSDTGGSQLGSSSNQVIYKILSQLHF